MSTQPATVGNGADGMQAELPSDRLMLEASRRIVANRLPGSNAFSGWLASLRHGITKQGESQAVVSAGPFLAGLRSDRERSGAMRAAAIRAAHKDCRGAQSLSLGASFARLAQTSGGTSIERQVATLPLLDLEAAAAVFDSLVGRCAKAGVAVNFTSLARTCVAWGAGATRRSQDVRNQIVLDFHSSTPSAAKR